MQSRPACDPVALHRFQSCLRVRKYHARTAEKFDSSTALVARAEDSEPRQFVGVVWVDGWNRLASKPSRCGGNTYVLSVSLGCVERV